MKSGANIHIKANPVAQEPKRFALEKIQNNFLNSSPEIKIKIRIEFGKDYLDRAYIDEDNEPDIMRLNFTDQGNKICYIKVSKCFKIIAIGYNQGKIKVYYLTEELIPEHDETELVEKENDEASAMREEPTKNLINANLIEPENNFLNNDLKYKTDNEELLKAKPKDFEYNLKVKN